MPLSEFRNFLLQIVTVTVTERGKGSHNNSTGENNSNSENNNSSEKEDGEEVGGGEVQEGAAVDELIEMVAEAEM